MHELGNVPAKLVEVDIRARRKILKDWKDLNMKDTDPTPTKTYMVNEIFYSLQGEGIRAGEPSIFLRFTGCNLRCAMEAGPLSPGGFNCDTEFMSGTRMTGIDIMRRMDKIGRGCKWVVCTGGEPLLQLDTDLCGLLHNADYKIAVETNGTQPVPTSMEPTAFGEGEEPWSMVDWITVSPKVAEHCIVQRDAHEVKYVRAYGQGIPRTVVVAQNYLISPALEAGILTKETLDWCIKLCLDNPPWRLSVQQHQLWKVR